MKLNDLDLNKLHAFATVADVGGVAPRRRRWGGPPRR